MPPQVATRKGSVGRTWGGSWGRSKSAKARGRRRRDRIEAERLEEQADLADDDLGAPGRTRSACARGTASRSRRRPIGAVVCRRGLARIGSSTFAGGLALAGYGPFPERDPIAQQDLLKLRREEVERHTTACRRVIVRLFERTKAEYDRYTTAHRRDRRCSIY
jgi:hypothetical protein